MPSYPDSLHIINWTSENHHGVGIPVFHYTSHSFPFMLSCFHAELSHQEKQSDTTRILCPPTNLLLLFSVCLFVRWGVREVWGNALWTNFAARAMPCVPWYAHPSPQPFRLQRLATHASIPHSPFLQLSIPSVFEGLSLNLPLG